MTQVQKKVYCGTFRQAIGSRNSFQRGGVIPITVDEKTGETLFCLGLDRTYLEWTDFSGTLRLNFPPELEALRELEEESRGIFSFKITTCQDHNGLIKQIKNRHTTLISKDSFNNLPVLYDDINFVVFIRVDITENDRKEMVEAFQKNDLSKLTNAELENTQIRWLTRDEIIFLCSVRKNRVGGFPLYIKTYSLLRNYCGFPKFGLVANPSDIIEMKKDVPSDETILDLNVPKVVSTTSHPEINLNNVAISDTEALTWIQNCKEYITKRYRTEMMTFLGIAPSIVNRRISHLECILRGNKKWPGRILLLFHTIAIERVLREYYRNGSITFGERSSPILVHSIDSATKIKIHDERLASPDIYVANGETINTKEQVIVYRKVLHSNNPLSLEDENLSDSLVWNKILQIEEHDSITKTDTYLSSMYTEKDVKKVSSCRARWPLLKSRFHLLGQPVLVFHRAESIVFPSITNKTPTELRPENRWRIVAKDTFPQLRFLHQHIGCHSQITPENILFCRKRYTLNGIGGAATEKVRDGFRRSKMTNYSNQLWYPGIIITPRDDLLEWVYMLNYIWLKSSGSWEEEIKNVKVSTPFHTRESFVVRNITENNPLYSLFIMIRDSESIDYNKIWLYLSPPKTA